MQDQPAVGRADEPQLLLAQRGIGVEQQRIDQRRGLSGAARRHRAARRHLAEQGLRVVDLLRCEAADRRDGGGGVESAGAEMFRGQAGGDKESCSTSTTSGGSGNWPSKVESTARMRSVQRRVSGPQSAELERKPWAKKKWPSSAVRWLTMSEPMGSRRFFSAPRSGRRGCA